MKKSEELSRYYHNIFNIIILQLIGYSALIFGFYYIYFNIELYSGKYFIILPTFIHLIIESLWQFIFPFRKMRMNGLAMHHIWVFIGYIIYYNLTKYELKEIVHQIECIACIAMSVELTSGISYIKAFLLSMDMKEKQYPLIYSIVKQYFRVSWILTRMVFASIAMYKFTIFIRNNERYISLSIKFLYIAALMLYLIQINMTFRRLPCVRKRIQKMKNQRDKSLKMNNKCKSCNHCNNASHKLV